VKFLPGVTYSMSGEPTSAVRLGFTSLYEVEPTEAGKRHEASLRNVRA
jgi:GntR family transcriptional regulator/MocR family aminotransferase